MLAYARKGHLYNLPSRRSLGPESQSTAAGMKSPYLLQKEEAPGSLCFCPFTFPYTVLPSVHSRSNSDSRQLALLICL